MRSREYEFGLPSMLWTGLRTIRLMIIVGMLVAQQGTRAQAPYSIPQLSGPVVLDGLSDDRVWQEIKPLPMTMYQPTYMGMMSERTEIRVGHDDRYLYLAGRFYDSDPEGILASSLSRDGGSGADDYFNVAVDPFNDNENALWFWTTPAGIRGDAAISNDAEGDTFNNPSWDTFWEVATAQNEEGWFAEVRIPFSSLGFQTRGDEIVMGLAVSRVISRKNERHVYPAIRPDWQMGFVKPSVAQDVVLEDVVAERPLYITPYVLSGLDQTTRLNETSTTTGRDDDLDGELGLDLKYNLTSNLTLDVSLNTDFAQVEADDQQVNLTRFSLFFPEKRPFFQERAGIFEYTFGFQERLFHSRQIGLSDGYPVRILGGARLVGRLGAWDFGTLNMQTARSDALPSENFGVLRLRRTVLNDNSYAGGIATSRVGIDGSFNVVYGLDGLIRIVGDEYLTLKWAQSYDDEVLDADRFGFFESGFAQLRWQRRRRQGLNYMFWLTRWGDDFVPELGFFTRRAYWQTLNRLAYDWLPGAGSPFRWVQADVFGNFYFRNADASLESGRWGTSETFEFKSGAQIGFELVGHYEDLRAPLTFADGTEVPAGNYTFLQAGWRYSMANGQRFRSNVELTAGSFYHGSLVDIGVAPTWNVSQHLELGASYRLNHVRFPHRDQGFDAHIVRVRGQMALNTRFSASAFVQYSNIAELVVANLRLRYNFRERNDLWIVYNEGLTTERDRDRLRLPRTTSRIVLVKYTYTFAL